MAVTAFAEIHPRTIERVGKNHWRGTRRFIVADSHRTWLENALFGSSMIGYSGAYAPKCTRVKSVSGYNKGESLIEAYYETKRQPGKAKTRIDVNHTQTTFTREPFGDKRIIEGLDPGDRYGRSIYRIIRGDNHGIEAGCKFIVETAFSNFDVDKVMSRVGRVNSNRLKNIGNARPGSMKLLGAPDTHWWPEGDLWYINYAFAYSGPDKLWGEDLEVQKGVWCRQKVPLDNGADGIDTTASTREIAAWRWKEYTNFDANGMPTAWKDTEPEKRVILKESSFADLDGWIEW